MQLISAWPEGMRRFATEVVVLKLCFDVVLDGLHGSAETLKNKIKV